MTDFFVSYTGADEAWAEWTAYVLEEEGSSVIIQAWDFRPGANFVLEMQKASEQADRTLMMLSPEYLKSLYAAPEWAAAFGHDPQGISKRLVPIMVKPCEPTGLLRSIVQIRLAGLDEAAARARLISGLNPARAKPGSRPLFPGGGASVQAKEFPGPETGTSEAVQSRPSLFSGLKAAPSDIEKRQFLRSGFATIKDLFEANARQASEEQPRIHVDIEMRTNADLRAELFLDGKSKSRCRVWVGGMHSSDNICFAEGQHFSDNSCNEIIHVEHDADLYFSATMGMGFSAFERTHDVKRMTGDMMAMYLWERFASRVG